MGELRVINVAATALATPTAAPLHNLGAHYVNPSNGREYRYVFWDDGSTTGDGVVGDPCISTGTTEWYVTNDMNASGAGSADLQCRFKGTLMAAATLVLPYCWIATKGQAEAAIEATGVPVPLGTALTVDTTNDSLKEGTVGTDHIVAYTIDAIASSAVGDSVITVDLIGPG